LEINWTLTLQSIGKVIWTFNLVLQLTSEGILYSTQRYSSIYTSTATKDKDSLPPHLVRGKHINKSFYNLPTWIQIYTGSIPHMLHISHKQHTSGIYKFLESKYKTLFKIKLKAFKLRKDFTNI
jgi:hypothetical protein